MASYVTDDGVCLRVTDFSETSQVAGLFTRGHGVVPLIAKGAKRQTKKGNSGTVSGPLDLLSRGEVVFIPAKGAAELGTLAAWELTDPRNGLRGRLAAFHAAMVIAELTTMLLHPHDPHPELFDQFNAALALAATDQRPRAVVAYAKVALEEAGYAPHLDACVSCGTPVVSDAALRYSPRAGGVICGKCPGQGMSVQTTGRIAVALDRLEPPTEFAATPPGRAADAGALLSAFRLLVAHAEAVADKGLRTRVLLGSVFTGGEGVNSSVVK
jgi:DNA repair protein RecO (recombination protein O)